jgi:hypothetical protein
MHGWIFAFWHCSGNAREIIKGLEKMPPPGAVLVERIDPV